MSRLSSCICLALMLLGCGDTVSLTWQYSFVTSSDVSRTTAIRARILQGSCESSVAIYAEQVSVGQTPVMPPELSEDAYGFEMQARDAECRVVAYGCQAFDLPTDELLNVRLFTTMTPAGACDPAETCVQGRCTTSPAP